MGFWTVAAVLRCAMSRSPAVVIVVTVRTAASAVIAGIAGLVPTAEKALSAVVLHRFSRRLRSRVVV